MPVPMEADSCSACKKSLTEAVSGWHPLSCMASGGRLMTARHDEVVMTLARMANLMGVVTLTEPADLSAQDGRRPDVEFHLPGGTLLIDVTIQHSAAVSYQQTGAKHGPDMAGDGRAAVNSDKYDGLAESHDMHFSPFVLYSTGGWHSSATAVLRKLSAAVEPAYCLMSRRDWEAHLTQQIAIALQRGNAAIMTAAAHRDQHCANGMHARPRPRPAVRPLPAPRGLCRAR
jgi:hypothetical protein